MRTYTRFVRLGAVLTVLSLAFVISCGKKSTGSGGGTPPPTGNTINIGDDFFNPTPKIVSASAIVTWRNFGLKSHTVTSNTGNELNSSTIPPGGSYTDTMNTVGTFGYHCSLHAGMNGSITVQ
jgi:plastocyanin